MWCAQNTNIAAADERDKKGKILDKGGVKL